MAKCDKCDGTGSIPDPIVDRITEYSLLAKDNEGKHIIINAKSLQTIINKCNELDLPPSGFKNWRGKYNWLSVGIRLNGEPAIRRTTYIWKIKGRWTDAKIRSKGND